MAMTIEEVRCRVYRLAGESLDLKPEQRITLRDEDDLEDDLGADSLSRTELFMELEDEFEIKGPTMTNDEFETRSKTLGRLVEYVFKYQFQDPAPVIAVAITPSPPS